MWTLFTDKDYDDNTKNLMGRPVAYKPEDFANDNECHICMEEYTQNDTITVLKSN